MKKMLETKFLFAGKRILIKTNNKKINEAINFYFPERVSKKKADLTIEYLFYKENFDLTVLMMKTPVKKFQKAFLRKEKTIFKSRKGKKKKMLVSGFLDLKKKYGKIEFRMNNKFFWDSFVLNIGACLIAYLNEQKATIIHSSAIGKKNKGFLFAGKGEAGKSTILKLCAETVTLGEDLNFLFKKGKKFFIQIFPFNTRITDIQKESVKPFELKAVFFLHKSKKLRLKKMTKKKSIEKMVENDNYMPFGFYRTELKKKVMLYAELFSSVPGFFLYFPLKENLWQELEMEIKKKVDLK